jgi:uncharacterized protein
MIEPSEPLPSDPPLLPAPPVVPDVAPTPATRTASRVVRHWVPARPPVWPSLLAPITALIASVFASGTVIVLLAILSNPRLGQGDVQKNIETWLEESVTKFSTIFATIVPVQMIFLGTAFLFVLVEREHWRSRLGFVRWKASHSTVALAVIGTLGFQFVIDLIANQLIDELSDSLKMLMRMFTEPRGLAAVGVGFLMSVLPGLCEETLFRGFTQRGLMRRWSPAVAIGVTSAFFALAHFDLQHSPAVIPLGVWVGYVAWKTGSVWPAVLCHFVNNLAAFILIRLWGDLEDMENPDDPMYYVVGAVLVAVAVLATIRLARTKPEAA